MKRANREDIAANQRSPSLESANTSRAGLALLIELRITEATSSASVSSRCAPAHAVAGVKSMAPPTCNKRRRDKNKESWFSDFMYFLFLGRLKSSDGL